MGLLGFGFLLALLTQDPVDPRPIDAAIRMISGHSVKAESPPCDDGEFLRRVMLDLVGHPPSAEERRVFVEDPAPGKRRAIVDRLLATERFADFWARRFMDVFFGDYRRHPEPRMQAFRVWLREGLHQDRPWGEIVREILEAEGDAASVPALAYKAALSDLPRFPGYIGATARHFMGIDLSCVGCHDHPFDRWNVDQGYSMSAFSSGRTIERVGKGLNVREGAEPPDRKSIPTIPLNHPWDSPPLLPPRFLLGGEPAPGEVLAKAYARFMVAPSNDAFRNAIVNRVWAWLFGRGLVHPVDDFNFKNKPRSRPALDLLTKLMLAKNDSLRIVIRSLCATEAYQRGCSSNAPTSRSGYTQAAIRPLSPEQLLLSIDVALDGAPVFDVEAAAALARRIGPGEGKACETRALPFDSGLLLWISGSEEIRERIRSGRAMKPLRGLPEEDRLRGVFLSVLTREPGDAERARFAGRSVDEVAWVLLNSIEFLSRH